MMIDYFYDDLTILYIRDGGIIFFQEKNINLIYYTKKKNIIIFSSLF